MRKWMYEKVTAISGLPVVDAQVFSSGAIGSQGDSPPRPFIVIRDGTTTSPHPEAKLNQHLMEVWVHDDQNSMLRIDETIQALIDNLSGTYGASTDEWSADCAWAGTSPDLFDDQFKTNCRYAEFRVTGSGP